MLRKHFNLDEILEFERKHRVEVEMEGTGQYGCMLDGNARYHGMGFTAMYAIWHAMIMTKRNHRPASKHEQYPLSPDEL